ncbi:MAG: histidine phosphatase family protein [Candidatus Eremiobacteraeota bacterium]|nr:histidine phosphatase family protein [Candidatus Eremiobacteraeota bacterium]
MAHLYVARHGETDFNRAGRYQGQLESDLTDVGLRQADALASALASRTVRRVVSSPLRRCTQTANAIAAKHGLEVTCDSRLLEIAHGTWEGRLRREIERDDPGQMNAWRTAPQSVRFQGGESLADVDARWREFAASTSAAADTIAVTHDVVVRLAILCATNRPWADLWKPSVCNGGFAVFEITDTGGSRRWTLVEECEHAHLGSLLVDPSTQAL